MTGPAHRTPGYINPNETTQTGRCPSNLQFLLMMNTFELILRMKNTGDTRSESVIKIHILPTSDAML